MSNTPLF